MGEQVTVTYKLYTRVQLGLEKIDYPKSVGFWQEDLSIPRRLVARCCIEALNTPLSIGQTIEITSGESISQIKMSQAIKEFVV